MADVLNQPSRKPANSRQKKRLPFPAPVFDLTPHDALPNADRVHQQASAAARLRNNSENENSSEYTNENVFSSLRNLSGRKILLVAGALELFLVMASLILIGSSNNDTVDVADSGPVLSEEIKRTETLRPSPVVEKQQSTSLVSAAKKPGTFEDEPANIVVDQPFPLSEADWRLAINFDRNGIGFVEVNGETIGETVLNIDVPLLLRDIENEVARRFTFLEPALGKRIKGVVSIDQDNFYFDDPTKLSNAIEFACTQVESLKFGRDEQSKRKFVEERVSRTREKIREQSTRATELYRQINKLVYHRGRRDREPSNSFDFPKTKAEFASMDLLNRKAFFRYAHEDQAIYEIVSITEKILQTKAIDRVAEDKLDVIENITLDEYWARLVHQRELAEMSKVFIDPEAFREFSETGKLVLPSPAGSSAIATSIQKLNPLRLKEQLSKQANEIGLFRNLNELKSAEKLVDNEVRASQPDLWKQLDKLKEQAEYAGTRLRKIWTDRSKHEERDELQDLQRKALPKIAILERQIARHSKDAAALEPLEELLKTRPHLDGLPLVMGEECHMDADSARAMNHVSDRVGVRMGGINAWASTAINPASHGNRDVAPNDNLRVEAIRNEIERCHDSNNIEQSLKTIDQLLQVDQPRLRLELVETLRQTESPASTEMLVKRAKYDLVPEVRQAATSALADRPFEEFRDELLDGLNYPWHVVAQHSAEALVGLDDQDAIPELVAMLELDDPRLPTQVDENDYIHRELVGVNHMKNCMLCHGVSTSTSDKGRGIVPTWEEPIPVTYYQGTEGTFVRADIVYLRQDFSVLQPVKYNGPWPKNQRFDYLVQDKKLDREQAQKKIEALADQPNLNREAIVYALRELTGQQPADDSHRTWLAIAERRKAVAMQDQRKQQNTDLRKVKNLAALSQR